MNNAIPVHFNFSIVGFDQTEMNPLTYKFLRGKSSESFDNHILKCKLVEVARRHGSRQHKLQQDEWRLHKN